MSSNMGAGAGSRLILERYNRFDTKSVLPKDRVRTKTGRTGVCKDTVGKDTAIVVWDDGTEFSIRFCHLEVLTHNWELPRPKK